MATFAYTDAYLSVDSNDISAFVNSLDLNYNAEALDDTSMSDTARSAIGGLKNWSISVEVNQDVAASQVDSIIFPLVGTVVAVEVRPDSAAVGASNPKFTGNILVTEYTPLQGSVGELGTATFTLQGTGALTRAVA